MSLARPKLTPEEYLEIERHAEVRSEFLDGEMYAMAGADEWHELIKANIIISLGSQFKGRPCRVYPSDMRVKVSETGLYTYPDASALCGESSFEDDRRDTLLNPSVIFEVLSRTTEAYDRGLKFTHYKSVQSLMEYVLISQDRVSVAHYTRQPNGTWTFDELTRLEDQVDLPAVGAKLALTDLYDKVDLSAVVNPRSPRG